MSTTAQNIFDMTMGLIDEISDTGATVHTDTQEYRQRTLFILNVLRGECWAYSATRRSDNCPAIQTMDEEIGLDDKLAQTVLPYGLAAQLLLDENPTAASFYQQRYEELLLRIGRQLSAASEDITDVYGGLAHCEYGRW